MGELPLGGYFRPMCSLAPLMRLFVRPSTILLHDPFHLRYSLILSNERSLYLVDAGNSRPDFMS